MVTIDKVKGAKTLYELLPSGKGKKGLAIRKRRVMVGSASSCQLVLRFKGIAPIHAIIEVGDKVVKIFDMNSSTGTYLNGEKIVSAELQLGDKLRLGPHEFTFKEYSQEEILPPPLEMLETILPPPIEDKKVGPRLPQKIKTAAAQVKTPAPEKKGTPPVPKQEFIPRVAYPLAKDPRAEFSEYIFEDVEELYPIFDYDVQHTAVEVIILHQDKIHSVDYLPVQNTTYHLVGRDPSSKDLEFAHLGKNEKFPFIEISDGSTIVYPLPGYRTFSLEENKKQTDLGSRPIQLRQDDIINFHKGDLQIFVCHSDAPPKVRPTPFFRRDKEMKKYILLVYLLLIALFGAVSLIKVDVEKEKEKEKEKAPERIATILYKKKLTVSKNNAVEKTPDAPQVVQKSPQETKPPEIKPVPEKTAGKPVVKNIEPPKKAQPKPAEVTKITPKVTEKLPEPSSRKAVIKTPAKGPVDVFRADGLTSSINSFLAKGGVGTKVSAATSNESVGSSSVATGGESATIKSAKVSTEVGSLVGAASGKLDGQQGTEGLVNKRGILTIGIPARTVILGAMDPDVIRRILMDHIPQFRNCYQSVLDRVSDAFDGVVPLSFVIGSSGHVTKAGLYEDCDLPSDVQGCVINVLKGIRFPEPQGGGVVEVKQPFNFYQKSR